jgi:type I restriction enzyme S subunit
MSRSRLSGLKDEQDLGTQKILKSLNQANPDADNRKQGNAPSLPKGWKIKKLDDLCQIELGKTPYRADKSFWDNEKKTQNVWLSIADLLNTDGDVVSDSKEYITDKAAKISKVVKKGTLLLSFKLTLGRLAFAGRDLYTNEAIAALSIKDEKVIDKYFLYHFLSFYDWNAATESDIKVKGKTLNKAKLKEIEIPLPPLPEQKRIVSILDECFAAIAKAKANAEQNLKNAKELLEVFLHKYFTNKEEGWEEKKLKDVAEYFNGLTYSPKDVSDKGIIVLRSSNIQNDKLDFSDIVRVNVSVKDKIIVKDGDILMCSRNGSKRLVGKTAPIENLPEQMTFGTFMMIVRSSYNPYLLWFFKSLDFKKQINGGENTMINQITRYMLDDIVVSFPPIEKQMEIVNQLNAIYIESQKLESIYQQKIADLEELKKSILQKAFSGQLSASGLAGLKDEQDLTMLKKPGKFSTQKNSDSDKHLVNPKIK